MINLAPEAIDQIKCPKSTHMSVSVEMADSDFGENEENKLGRMMADGDFDEKWPNLPKPSRSQAKYSGEPSNDRCRLVCCLVCVVVVVINLWVLK